MKIINQCTTTFFMLYNLLVFGGIIISPFDLFGPSNFPIKFSKFLEKLTNYVFFVHKLFQKNWLPVSFEDKPFYPPLFLCLTLSCWVVTDGHTLKMDHSFYLQAYLNIFNLLLPHDINKFFLWEIFIKKIEMYFVLNNTRIHVLEAVFQCCYNLLKEFSGNMQQVYKKQNFKKLLCRTPFLKSISVALFSDAFIRKLFIFKWQQWDWNPQALHS